MKYLNYYQHDDCPALAEHDETPMWTDTWDCQCNDECPICGAEIEPYDSEEIE